MVENQASPPRFAVPGAFPSGCSCWVLRLAIVTSLWPGWPLLAQEQAPQEAAESATQESPEKPLDVERKTNEEAEEGVEVDDPVRARRRIRFELKLEDESGGGTVIVFAEELRQLGEIYQMEGSVEIRYRDTIIRADSAEMDRGHQTVVGFGNVILDQGPTRLTGATIEYDLDSETGVLTEARGYTASDYYFRGSEIRKTGESTYVVLDGLFTSCDQEVPSWSFRAGRTTVTVDRFARARNATMRVRKMPVFYWPYLVFPVKSERSSGLLVPKPGQSARRGSSLGLAYFQTLGRSADTTFYLDLFSEDYTGYGNEFRYRASQGTSGSFEGYAIEDPELDELRWKIKYQHLSNNLPWGLRGWVDYENVSDFDFYRDYERQVRVNSKRHLYSRAFISGNWGRQSFNLLFDQLETLVEEDSLVTLRQLPEVEYKLRSTQLGSTPLYLQMQGSVHFLDVDRTETYSNSYLRTDLNPQISWPFKAFPWLSLSLHAGAQYTTWSDSLRTRTEVAESEDGLAFRGGSLSRFQPSAFAEIVGPTFSRIFEGKGKHFSRFKHVIEPRFAYANSPAFDDFDRIPRFDRIDSVGRRGSTLALYSLVNRLLAKSVEEGESAREILSLKISQLVSLINDQPLQESPDGSMTSQSGPIVTSFRFQPNPATQLQVQSTYNTLFGEIESNSLSGTFRLGPHDLGLRWTSRTTAETSKLQKNQARASASIVLWPKRLLFSSALSYDLKGGIAIAQHYAIDYTGNCYGVRLEFSRFSTLSRPEVNDRQFRFALRLKNIGTFFDLTSGSTETL